MVYLPVFIGAMLAAIVVKVLSGNSLAAELTAPTIMMFFIALDAMLRRTR